MTCENTKFVHKVSDIIFFYLYFLLAVALAFFTAKNVELLGLYPMRGLQSHSYQFAAR